MKFSLPGLAISAGFALIASQATAATVIFDDFNDFQIAVDQPYQGVSTTSTIAFGNGTRTLTAENTSNNGNAIASTTLESVGGALSFSNDDMSTGRGTLTYTNLGDISSGANPFFHFDLGVLDNVAQFMASATDIFGNTSTFSEVLTPTFSATLFFSEFVGNADFNNIAELSFMIDTTDVPGFGAVTQVDGSLNAISLNAPAPIPLPATGLLLVGAMGGLAFLRRKTRA